MTIFHHPRFSKSFIRLPENIKQKAEKRVAVFRKNQFDRILKTHKLRGKLQMFWSFSVDAKYRIIFEFDGPDVIFLDIGDHGLYK